VQAVLRERPLIRVTSPFAFHGQWPSLHPDHQRPNPLLLLDYLALPGHSTLGGQPCRASPRSGSAWRFPITLHHTENHPLSYQRIYAPVRGYGWSVSCAAERSAAARVSREFAPSLAPTTPFSSSISIKRAARA